MGAVTLVLLGALGIIGFTQAGHSHQGYFQYLNVPAHGQYEFGFHRGNQDHYISRYEQSKDWKFRTKVRWGDKKGGYGEHYFDYNHVDKGKHDEHGHGHGHHEPVHHHGHGHGHGWHGGYSEPSPAVVPGPAPSASDYSPSSKQLEVIYAPPRSQYPKPQPMHENRRRMVLPQEWQETRPQVRPTAQRRAPAPRRRSTFFRRFRQ